MHTQNRRHRLFLAAPVFALCLAWSFVSGITQASHPPLADLPGTTLRIDEEEHIVRVPGGIIRLTQDSDFRITDNGPELVRGSLLAVADGRLAITVGDADVSGWAGGFHLTVFGDRISIAALTTPVRIDRKGATTIVPPRTQVPSLFQASIVPVPQHFLREQLPAIARLTDLLPPSPLPLDSSPPSFVASVLRLPAARERADKAAGRGTDCGLHLVTAASDGKASDLLRPCLEQAEDWMLLSFHLAVRNAVWSLPVPASASIEDRISRIELLPISDRGPNAVPEQVVEWWAEDAAQILSDASGSVLSDRLPVIAEHIAHLSRAGYPDRAKRYALHLLALREDGLLPTGSVVPMLQSVLMDAVPRLTLPSVSLSASVSVPAAESAPSMDADHLLADADRALRTAGFMFTGRTHLEPEGAAVAVRDIVLGTPKGHQILQFSYNPVTDTVSRIGIDGKILPYNLPLARYVKWLRGEKLEEE